MLSVLAVEDLIIQESLNSISFSVVVKVYKCNYLPRLW